jgi:hypothetical protein
MGNTTYFHKMEKIREGYMPITLLHQNKNVFSTYAEIEVENQVLHWGELHT